MDGATPAPRVLVLGFDPYRVPGPWDPRPVADGIQAGRARFVEHGLGAEFCLFGVDGSDDVEAVVSAALSAHAWDCVVVGRGVRNSLELFERLINLVRRHAPDAAIAFNATRRRRSTQPRAGWKPAVDARAALRRGAPLPHDGPRG